MELTRCQNAYFRYPNNMRLAYIDFIKIHTSTCVYYFNYYIPTITFQTFFKLHIINLCLENEKYCMKGKNITHLSFLPFFNTSITCSILKITILKLIYFPLVKEHY